ncbi:MAG TPA: ThuA domain-containing protein [Opitutaceae bacterium]|nr:ThuA domain-containing protein [Opitutaceae bacterium]
MLLRSRLALLITVSIPLAFFTISAKSATGHPTRVLVFSKTANWRHDSIPAGIAAIKRLGAENDFEVVATEDGAAFQGDALGEYGAIIFLNTTGRVLRVDQRLALQRYIQAGGGFVGIHSAAATEYDWPWYNQLLGAYLSSHPLKPGVRHGAIDVVDRAHPATQALPERWERDEEWYSFRNILPNIHVLANLDENSYEGGTNGRHHPIIWCHDFDGGRAFYTALGHEASTFDDPLFLKHLLGGIRYAIGSGSIDYARAKTVAQPEEDRFNKTVLIDHLRQPMELAIAPDGRVYFTELATGNLHLLDPKTGTHAVLHHFDVSRRGGTGLIGVTLDPHFERNGFIYLYYAPPIEGPTIYFQLSRFTVANDAIDPASEKVYFKVPVLPNGGSHHGGSLAWDRDGNLYLSTGDSTAPAPADGYAPLDERPGQEHVDLDAQRSAANTNDLKGKVLRIHPEADGTYTIPAGNLFKPGTDKTRPEIYVMGCRNPYRIAVNPVSSVLYWGDIGPDAGVDSERGPKGYDEFNQARAAGNYGWPYFVGNNQAYPKWNYATRTPGEKQDPRSPKNHSPNNTGLIDLPAAHPAMIWYPYATSKEFPLFGEDGRSAMAGAFYEYDALASQPKALPKYYDKALFVFDWMRNWIMALRFDEKENYIGAERFMASSGDFRRPIDLAFGPDGAMYLLEYGSVYGADNPDARLTRIEYITGTRPLVAKAGIVEPGAAKAIAEHNARVYLTSEEIKVFPTRDDVIGAAPLSVDFTAQGSIDPDGGSSLSYRWTFGDGSVADGKTVSHTFEKNGEYRVILKVAASDGRSASDAVVVRVGNEAPRVEFETAHNASFFWPEESDRLHFRVHAQDREDGDLTSSAKVTLQYQPEPPFDINNNAHASAEANGQSPIGEQLISRSDCRACHVYEKTLVGPGFAAIAERYRNDAQAVEKLAAKVIHGGAGNWGVTPMAAHPQIARGDAEEIVRYILSSQKESAPARELSTSGEVELNEYNAQDKQPEYILTATVSDRGANGSAALEATEKLRLRPAKLRAAYADEHVGFQRYRDSLGLGNNKAYLRFKAIDLTTLTGFSVGYRANQAGVIEVRLDSFAGPLIARSAFVPTPQSEASPAPSVAQLQKPQTGKHDLYFIFRKTTPPDEAIISPQWVEFQRRAAPGASPNAD